MREQRVNLNPSICVQVEHQLTPKSENQDEENEEKEEALNGNERF